jgi:ferredoxin
VSHKRLVWIDVERCTGCTRCVAACPVGAITVVQGKARVEESVCMGCGACIDVCPENAIQYVLEGEVVPAQEPYVPAVRQPSPVAQAARPVATATGTLLFLKAAEALLRAAGRWLTSMPSGSPSGTAESSQSLLQSRGDRGGGAGRGRRERHRHGSA